MCVGVVGGVIGARGCANPGGDEVNMKMRHVFANYCHADIVAIRCGFYFVYQIFGNDEGVRQLLVGDVLDPRIGMLGDNQCVSVLYWVNVQKGESLIILKHNVGRYLSGDDFFKNSWFCNHGRRCILY